MRRILIFVILAITALAFTDARAVCQANGRSCGNQGVPSNDRLCCPGSICGWGNVCNPGCRINGRIYASGALNPANACQACRPSSSTTAWSSVTNGAACGNPASAACDRPDTCLNGTCRPNLVPAGTTCRPIANSCDVAEVCDGIHATCPVDLGIVCPAAVCEVSTCDPATGVCSTPETAPDFTPCPDDGNLCTFNERCIEGVCGPTVLRVCEPGTYCDPALGDCVPATFVP